MKEYTSESSTVKNLSKWLGADRVKPDHYQIILSFNLADPLQMHQFHRFGDLARRQDINFATNEEDKVLEAKHTRIITSDVGDDAFVRQLIIKAGNDRKALRAVSAELADVMIVREDTGGFRRRILEHDPEYVVPGLTGVKCDVVSNSPYGNVIEAVVPETVRPETRWEQEAQLAKLLRPSSTQSHDFAGWAKEQAGVQKALGLKPKTLFPADWANMPGIARAYQAPSDFKNELPRTFRKER